MSGFDLSELLPFYLDESDEQIGILNDALLRLEQEPSDAQALQEAFRIVHSLKGSSSVMGFESVNKLSHHLESYFDQLRSRKRTLDRPALNICFACLDRLREFQRDLRAGTNSPHLLTEATAQALLLLQGDHLEASPTPTPAAPTQVVEPAPEYPSSAQTQPPIPTEKTEQAPPPLTTTPPTSPATYLPLRATIVFESGLPWRDMKARLILNRLASRLRVLASDPPSDQLDGLESLPELKVWLDHDVDQELLGSLVDVDGVAEVSMDHAPLPPESSPTTTTPAPVPAPVAPAPTPAAERSLPPPPITPSTPSDTIGPPVAPTAELPAAPTEIPTTTTLESPPPAPQGTPPTPDQPIASPATPAPRKSRIVATLRVDAERLDHLMNLAGELVITRARFAQIASSFETLLQDNGANLTASDAEDRLDRVAASLEAHHLDSQSKAELPMEHWAAQLHRVREDVRSIREQLDHLHKGREQLMAMTEAIDQLARVADGIQKGVLDTRMVPIGPLFERFRRVVRDLCVASGKEVALKILGDSTELDKRMIDELADPLVHMVRNAVDHGLESPEKRKAANKPPAGTVTLQAAHRGNSIVITVSDDGRGIDTNRIRDRVIAQGLLPEKEARRLSVRQLIEYIWRPGLTTAETVTDVSGRGVGMDVVRNRIEQLSGSVDVRSEPGRGTTFQIRLPLTLAILPSLLVRIYDEYYALPLDAVVEIIEVQPHLIHSIHGTDTIDIRGVVIPLLELNDLFRWGGADHPSFDAPSSPQPSADNSHRYSFVLIQNGENTIGLRVDELVGIQEIVLKSVERNFQVIPGLSGASILGDGRVSLILDVDALVQFTARPSSSARKGPPRRHPRMAVGPAA